MKRIAITGGIASGKSSLCHWLRHSYHFPVFSADKTVHQLYRHPLIIEAVRLLFPADTVQEGKIHRPALAAHLANYPDDLELLEALIHPLVRRKEQLFWQTQRRHGCEIVFSEIPLLFETGSVARYDAVIVTHAPLWLREKRAMQRHHMTAAKWRHIIHNQVNDATRIRQADYLILTGIGKAHSWHSLREVIHELTGEK